MRRLAFIALVCSVAVAGSTSWRSRPGRCREAEAHLTSRVHSKLVSLLRLPRGPKEAGANAARKYASVPPGYQLELHPAGKATYELTHEAANAAGGWRGLTARGTWRLVEGRLEVELTHAAGGAVQLPRPGRVTLAAVERGSLLVSGRLPGEPHRFELVQWP